MTTKEAIKLLHKSGSVDRLLNMSDKVVDQRTDTTVNQPTLEEIQF